MEDIHELYKRAGELHGHFCPGLAIGVRAAVLALDMLEITDNQSKGLYCIAENRACYIDGIQMIFGTSLGKGSIEIRMRGKTAFNFYDRGTGKAVRLLFQAEKHDKNREEMTEYILTAPAKELFKATEPVIAVPENHYVRVPSRYCERCGEETLETFLTVIDGVRLCSACAEM